MKTLIYHVIIGITALIIGSFFIITGIEAYKEYARQERYSGVATGYIIKKNVQRASDGNSVYNIDYWFLIAHGKKIYSTGNILKENWDNLKMNDSLEIKYDKSNPNKNIPLYGGNTSLVYVFFVMILGMVFIVFGVMRFITGYKEFSKKKT